MRVVGLRVELQGDDTNLKALNGYQTALEKVAKQSTRIRELTKKIKELEKALDGVSKGDPNKKLPGGEPAKENIKTLASLRAEMKQLATEGKTFDNLAQEAGKLKAQATLVNQQINKQQQAFIALTSAAGSYRQINAQLVILRNNFKGLSKADQTGKIGKEMLSNIQRLDSELKQLDSKMGQYQRNVGNYVSAFRGLKTIAFNFASLIGVSQGLDEIVRQNAKISDSLADVRKTTGLAKEDLRALRNELTKLDTRTSLEGLLGIAEGAGRLGLGGLGVEGLEEFVEAVDKVNVALGDTLDGGPEKIATDLAKISNTFDLDQTFGVAGGIERVGAALNLLGAETKANENFILQATNRLQGIGATAGLTAPQILGLSATFDELALTNELATGAISSFLSELAASPENFVELAASIGVSEEKFMSLIQNNPNEAFIVLLEAAQSSKGGLDALGETLEALGVKGVRQGQTLTALSNNVDLLRKNQALANTEFAKTQEEFQQQNSLYDEFKVKNENLAASIEKAKNVLIAFITQSGVQDFLQAVIEGLTRLILNLISLPKFIKDNRVALGLLVLAVIAFNAQAIKAQLSILRLAASHLSLQNAQKAARAAQLALNAAFAANPIGIVVGILALLAAGLATLYKRSETFRTGVQGLWKAMVQLYEQNILVKAIFFAIVEPLKLLIGVFNDAKGTAARFRDNLKLFAIQISEFLTRMGLAFEAFKLTVKKSLTFGVANRKGIEDQLKAIEDQIKASKDRVEKAGIEVNKKQLERERQRAQAAIEAEKKKVAANKKANEETEEQDEERIKKAIEAQKRRSAAARKRRLQQLEQETKDRLVAAEKIAALEDELIQNQFDRRAAQAERSANKEIAGLVGDPDQIDKQTTLILEKLKGQLDAINKEREVAQQKALQQIKSFNQQIVDLQTAFGVNEAQAEVDGIRRLFTFEEGQIQASFKKARTELSRQLSENLITITDYERNLTRLNREVQQQRLELRRKSGANELDLQITLFEKQEEQLRLSLERERAIIAEDRKNRNRELNTQFEQGSITEEEFNTGINSSELLAQEQQLQAEREFELKRQQQAQELALQALDFNTEIADREAKLVEEKNKRIIASEKAKRDIAISFTEDLSSKVTELVTGQIEDFKEFQKAILLLALDALEKTILLYTVQATGREIATKGFLGIGTGAVLTGIIKAAFAGVKNIISKFEEGGDIGTTPIFAGNHVPTSGGLVRTGKLHPQGGIKGVAAGLPVEIERNEYVLRNGPLTHIINRRSTKAMLPLLNTLQRSFPHNRFSAKRAAVAHQVNALPFQDGGLLPNTFRTPPLPAPVSPRNILQTAANSSNLSTAADLTAFSQMLLDLIQATNARIDRIQVINKPEETVRAGNIKIQIENRINQ